MKTELSLTIAIMMVASIFSSCSDSKEKSGTPSSPTEITVPQAEVIVIGMNDVLQKMSDADLLVLDVRSPEEYEDGHLKNAVNINVNGENFQTEIEKLNKENSVIVYCKSGTRSTNAASQMQALGFKTIYNYTGGFSEWASSGNELAE